MMSISGVDRVRIPSRTRSDSSAGRSDRPRIVILSTWHPEPADNGRKQRTRFMISTLSEHYDVVLVSLLPEEMLTQALPEVPGVWKQFELPLPVFRPGALDHIALGANRYPRSISATWSESTNRAICHLAREFNACAVLGTDLRTLRYLEAVSDIAPAILDEPDVSPFLTNGGWSVRARLRELKYRRLLAHASRRLSAAIVASEHEAVAYRTLSGGGHVAIVENGVPALPETTWRPVQSTALLYTGSLRYAPNAEAVEYFVSQILPRCEDEFPDLTLTVTGDRPDAMTGPMRHPAVELTGRLPSLHDTFIQSRLFVAPILSGTGTRIKLLEAMAYGMPIVSTTKGAEGLPVEHGIHLLLADDPTAFAGAVRQLLLSPDLSLRIGGAARELVRSRFTWDVVGGRLTALVNDCVREMAEV